MDRQMLLEHLTTRELGRPLAYFESTDSTNTQALRAAAAGKVGHGAAFVAARQTAGRGSHGKCWESGDAEGLCMSLVLQSATQSPPAALTLMPGVAVANVLQEAWGVEAHLKWPNDVMVGTRKIAGVLVESREGNSGNLVNVVGIGVNLNQAAFPAAIKDIAVSARMARGRCVPVAAFFGQLMAEIEALWRHRSQWIAQWLSRSRMIGCRAELQEHGSSRSVTVMGLSRSGALQVRGERGDMEEIISRAGLDLCVNWEAQSQRGLATSFSGASDGCSIATELP